MHPVLIAYVDGAEVARLEPPPAIAARAWLLAVMAVQVSRGDGGLEAVLRVNATGRTAELVPLALPAVVHLALAAPGAPPPALPAVAATRPGLAVWRDGAPAAHAACPAGLAAARAFGHLYARWLRDGGHESGFDLTAFQAPAAGRKYERLIHAPLPAPPALISYGVA